MIAEAIEDQIFEAGEEPEQVIIKVPSSTSEASKEGLHFYQFGVRSALLGASRAGVDAIITTEESLKKQPKR